MAFASSFTQRDYPQTTPFSSFLPGIAGLYGKPLWCYYVNRGQAVACFGTQDKDHGIMAFQSANLHYARVEQEGFRTLVRWPDGRWYEPFRSAVKTERTFTVTPSALQIEECTKAAGLKFTVEYTTVPGECCAALLRSVTIRNILDTAQEFEWVDGFPQLMPYGLDHHASQNAPFICQGYLNIDGLEENLPFYRFLDAPSYLHVIPERPSGNFYFGFVNGQTKALPVIVDGDLIFGEGSSLAYPGSFAGGGALDLASQKTACMTASAFVRVQSRLAPGETVTVHSLCGMATDFATARAFRDRAMTRGWIAEKRGQSALEVEKVRHRFFIHSSDRTLNEYLPQTFLDNVLRGGLPITLKCGGKSHNLHVFNRVHGDLERDYNAFKLDPTCFSQGNGHYRDVNQNRRNDVWFNPAVGTGNLRHFFNLLRLDGYNPMECQGVVFRLDDGEDAGELADMCCNGNAGEALVELLSGEFTPGELLGVLESAGVQKVSFDAALKTVLARSKAHEKAKFGTGFWIDHWFYCFDQLERYLALYPDRLEHILLEDRTYTYWDDEHRVLPRSERYLLVGDGLIHQVGNPVADPAKKALIATRSEGPNQVRTQNGTGEIYQANLLEKILCLILNKAATLAPSGCGIEMEAGHPGWHDSINRLPYQFGASTSEMFQLLRAARMLSKLLNSIEIANQSWPEELVAFLDAVGKAVVESTASPLAYWQTVNDAKETFRQETWMGPSGRTGTVGGARMSEFLANLVTFLEARCNAVLDPDSRLPITYYIHHPVEYTIQTGVDGVPLRSADGYPRVCVTRFEAEPLTLFLEAPVHALRIAGSAESAEKLCQSLRNSQLFDRKLNMYLLGDSLKKYGVSVGRIGMWTPGWFENENVFMHMEHKLLLSMFESGRYERLFHTMRDIMVPFQPPERYGRSPIENTSFIVSSRHPAPERHGRGYLPRSSGTTAEVIDLFLRLSFGDKPFRLEDGELALEFSPVLPAWMFSESEAECTRIHADGRAETIVFPANTYAALFLGQTLVTYHNPKRLDTFGSGGARVRSILLTSKSGSTTKIDGPIIRGELAMQARNGAFEAIKVDLL